MKKFLLLLLVTINVFVVTAQAQQPSKVYLINQLTRLARIGNAYFLQIDTSGAGHWITLTSSAYVDKLAIYNQYASKQPAKAWVDSLRANSFHLKGSRFLNDSSVIFYLNNKMAMGQGFNQLVLTNTGVDSIPAVYQAAGGIQNGPYNQASLLINRKFSEAKNDTLNLQYGGSIVAYNEHRYDSNSTRFKAGTKHIGLPNGGFYADNRFYPPRDSVDVFAGGDGQTGNSVAGYLSIGDTWGYNLNVFSGTLPKYPLASFKSELDLQRNGSWSRLRKATGNGFANYLADWKSYQGGINSGTAELGNYQAQIVDFFSYGSRDSASIGTAATKDKILRVSKVDKAIGFYSRQKYQVNNEVYNGYGFYQEGANDFNFMQGKVKIGGSEPNRDNGGLAQNLVVAGSARTDTLFNLYQKIDSVGKMVFTPKNTTAHSGGFVIDIRSTLDSTSVNGNTAGGVFVYRNWLDYKTNSAFQRNFDSRDYYRLSTNRVTTLGACVNCPEGEFHGYKQIIGPAGASISSTTATIKPTVYHARSELTSTSGQLNAPNLELVGYSSQLTFVNADSLGAHVAFKDYGNNSGSANKILNYYSFKSDVTNVAENTYGFYQSNTSIKNYFGGNVLLGSNLNLPTSQYISWGTSIGSSGYGFRENAGRIQFKHSGEDWADIGAGGSPANLSVGTRTATAVPVNNSNGTGFTLPAVDGTNAGAATSDMYNKYLESYQSFYLRNADKGAGFLKQLWVKNDSTGVLRPISFVAGSNITIDTTASTDSTMVISISATGGGGSGDVTNEYLSLPALSTPGSFTATASSSSQIDLTWSDVSNEENYQVQRTTTPETAASWTTINTPAANAVSFNNTGLVPSTQYYYRLRAVANGSTERNSLWTFANATTNASAAAEYVRINLTHEYQCSNTDQNFNTVCGTNANISTAGNVTFGSLKKDDGVTATSLSITNGSGWLNYNNAPSSGSESGVFTDLIISTTWLGNDGATITIGGLTSGASYTFYFLSNANAWDGGTVSFTVGGQTTPTINNIGNIGTAAGDPYDDPALVSATFTASGTTATVTCNAVSTPGSVVNLSAMVIKKN